MWGGEGWRQWRLGEGVVEERLGRAGGGVTWGVV